MDLFNQLKINFSFFLLLNAKQVNFISFIFCRKKMYYTSKGERKGKEQILIFMY